MIFNITKIKTGKVKSEDVSFTYKPKDDELKDDRFKLLSDIDVNGKVYYADGAFRFEAVMNATCEFVCDRCQSPFTCDFECDFEEEYKADVLEDDEDYFQIKDDNIDLSLGIARSFILNLPLKLLCSEDCEGIDYNIEEIYEKNSDDKKDSSPFAGLKDLKF